MDNNANEDNDAGPQRGDKGSAWSSFVWTSKDFNRHWRIYDAYVQTQAPNGAVQPLFLCGSDMYGRRFYQVVGRLPVGTTENIGGVMQEIRSAYGEPASGFPRSKDVVLLMYHKGTSGNVHPGTGDFDELGSGIDVLTPTGVTVVLHPLRTFIKEDNYRRPTGMLVARADVLPGSASVQQFGANSIETS